MNNQAIMTAIDNALALLDRAQSTTDQTSKNLERLRKELRNAR